MPSPPNHELVQQQIERLSLRRFQWLSFPTPLEDRFEHDTSAYRQERMWAEGLIAVGFFNLFLLANLFFLHSISWHDVLVHTGLITPVALLVTFSLQLNSRRVVREAAVAVTVSYICLIHLYLELSPYALGPAYAQVGVIVAVLFTNVVVRLQFPYALAASLAMMVGDLVFLKLDRTQGPAETVFGTTMTLCAIVITVIANYSLGREERLAYLLRLRGELQSARLSMSNEELQRLSSMDSLTGLANRHAFGTEYQKLWKQALTSRTPISAVLIDIDNFKAVNDLLGHLYGDQVLQRVAMLLQQALRGKHDFAARFGGDEFVLLLPGTTPEIALMVAERIRKLVEVAGAPALEKVPDLPLQWATVTCGVSTCWPTHTDLQENLLGAADKALYQAKQTGRNRVCYCETAMVRITAQVLRGEMQIG